MKLLFIFQRRLYPEHRKATENYIKKYQMEQKKRDPLGYYRETSGGSYGTLPANHGSTIKGNRKSKIPSTPQPSSRVRFQDENPDEGPQRDGAYFNQILGRYVYPVANRDHEPQARQGAAGAVARRGSGVGHNVVGRGGAGHGGAGRGGLIPNGVPPGDLSSLYSSPSLGPIVHGKR